jgi:alpha-L-fucosidase 2
MKLVPTWFKTLPKHAQFEERRSFLAGLAAISASIFSPRTTNALRYLSTADPSPEPSAFDAETTLWYSTPAANWLEAAPLGNGRIGAMVFGGTAHEQLMLNEETLYAEEPGGRTFPLDIAPEFDHVVSLLKAGEYIAANEVATRHWLGRCWPCYQPFGTLHLQFPDTQYSGYRRELSLSDAIQRTRYVQDGVQFERDAFASAPDDAIIYRIKANKARSIHFKAWLDSDHPTARLASGGDKEVVLAGKLPGISLRRTLESVEQAGDTWKYPEIWNKDGSRKPFAKQILYGDEVGGRGMSFEGRLRVLHCDGKVNAGDSGVEVTDAGEVVLGLSMASSFNGYAKSPSRDGLDPSIHAKEVLDRLAQRSYEQLRETHVADYQRLFHRVSFHLEGGDDSRNLSTDQRRKAYTGNSDPSFASLFFQFGRYLLISCSRPGGQPANLQGIWNVDRLPPWSCAYTVNINLQMNYWGAETANLSECHGPLMDFMQEMYAMGQHVAQKMYHRPGWVMHHNTTIWRDAQPVDWVASTSFWPMGSGWLCQHLWEHYQFTGDEEFLRETAYPIMKGAAEFYDSWLIEDENGHLLTPVSGSPENSFYYTDRNGKEQVGALAMGCTLDMAIIRELFANVIWSAAHLKKNDSFRERLSERIPRLLPYQTGSRGELMEWFKDFKSVPPRHNTSPYYPLYPGNQITPRETPALALAEKLLLEERARKGGGFPAAWMAGCWARLNEPDTGLGYLERLYTQSLHPNLLNGSGEIFQIDANLGAMASTIEFLLQSHAGEIELLPALPSAWKAGQIRGLRARGGFEVSVEWSNGTLAKAEIVSIYGKRCTVRYGDRTAQLRFRTGETKKLNGLLISA